MLKKIFVILLMLLSLNAVFAEKIQETSFSALGYGNLNISENATLCKVYEFRGISAPENSKVFLNLFIENYIPVTKDVDIDVYLNNILEKKIMARDLVANNHVELVGPIKENNQLKICVNNFSLPLIIISNKSTIGSYYIGEINSTEFYQKVLTTERYNHTLIPIEIYAENNSPKAVMVNIVYADDVFLKNSNLQTVSGQTAYDGEILPGETKVLKYYLKADKTISFSTPQARLTYTDEFGTEKTLYAKQEIINLVEKENKIDVFIDIPRDAIINQPENGKIIIRNVSENDIRNISIETSFDSKIVLTKRNIDVLKKYAVEEIPFEVNIDSKGEHTLNTTVYYNVGDKENGVSAQLIRINADTKTDYVKEMIGVFLLITIIVYIWIVRF